MSPGHCREYNMRCVILGRTKKYIKLKVFGERDWKWAIDDGIEKIRYLPIDEEWRLYEKQK